MTLELGVNVVIGWELDEFEEKMGKFVDKIVTANPEKWIFITDMMPFMMDVENNPKTDAFRRAVAKKAESIQSDKVAYITGPKLLKSINGLSTDILHPSCLGAEEIASNFIEFIKAKIGKGEHYDSY
jgi:hypothetical protein